MESYAYGSCPAPAAPDAQVLSHTQQYFIQFLSRADVDACVKGKSQLFEKNAEA